MKFVKAFYVTVKKDEEEIEIPLRITIKGQLAVKRKYVKDFGTVLSEAITDPEKGLFILEQALAGSEEKRVSGPEELYDLLVEAGMAGFEDFAELYFNIAHESGIISEKNRDSMLKRIRGTVDEAFGDDDEKN